jgi:hypothetical protein
VMELADDHAQCPRVEPLGSASSVSFSQSVGQSVGQSVSQSVNQSVVHRKAKKR